MAAKSIVFMNNKGGVGKTTLACNLAYHMASKEGQNVLFLDLDPQCNATQLLLDEDTWVDILDSDKAHEDKRSIQYALSAIRVGDSNTKADIEPIRSPRFEIDVLTGHPGLAMFEDNFSEAWTSLLSSNLGGARRTNWVSSLLRKGTSSYDLVFVDVGPSLGALNRTVLIGSDHVLTPTAADLFSLYALDNIAKWSQLWGRRYREAIERVQEEFSDDFVEEVDIADGSNTRYLGYTIQQYVSKSSSGTRRSVRSHDYYRDQIPPRAHTLDKALGGDGASHGSLDLGTVPHMFSMVPLAQSRHAPISSLEYADGLRGAQISQQASYAQQLDAIGERLAVALHSRPDDEDRPL